MSVTVEQPEINLRKELAKNRNRSSQFVFMVHFVGVASLTTFVMPVGTRPIQVFNDGGLQREGAGGDNYVLTRDVDEYSVVFNTAPIAGNTVDMLVESWL